MLVAVAGCQSGGPTPQPASVALAPGLMPWIARADHEVVETDGDLFARVRSGELELAVLVDPDYAVDFAAGAPARVRLIVDGSKNELSPLVRRARRVLGSYGTQVSTLRLIARGVSTDLRTPVRLEELDIATSQQRSANFLSFIPLFIITAAFVSGMNVAIDTTAGERERGSLEPLLMNPVSRNAIVIGKWLVTVVFASAGIVLVLAGTLTMLRRMSLEDLVSGWILAPCRLSQFSPVRYRSRFWPPASSCWCPPLLDRLGKRRPT